MNSITQYIQKLLPDGQSVELKSTYVIVFYEKQYKYEYTLTQEDLKYILCDNNNLNIFSRQLLKHIAINALPEEEYSNNLTHLGKKFLQYITIKAQADFILQKAES